MTITLQPVSSVQPDWRLNHPRPPHLYIHIPFCHRRCAYCDFNTFANMEDRMEAYVAAWCVELRGLAAMPIVPQPPTVGPGLSRSSIRPTVFLGGGTPSMLPITSRYAGPSSGR